MIEPMTASAPTKGDMYRTLVPISDSDSNSNPDFDPDFDPNFDPDLHSNPDLVLDPSSDLDLDFDTVPNP